MDIVVGTLSRGCIALYIVEEENEYLTDHGKY